MRVLLQGRSRRSLETTPGGDQVKLEQTARALRSLYGVDARSSSDLEPDLSDVDAVHLFGIVRPQEVWIQARNARRQHKPVLLSPVYCDFREFERSDRTGPVGWTARQTSPDVYEALKAAGRALHNREWSKGSATLFTRGFTRMERDIADMTALFLPDSWSEWHRLTRDLELDVPADRIIIGPNGVDTTDLDPSRVDPVELERFAHLRDAVICVARIEGRKNQLRLIESLRGTGRTLVLAGRPTPNQARYVAKVREAAAASENVHFLGEVSNDTRRVLYALARVHVLPSWMETTGLSSLEAAAMGCSVVVTPNGDTREYFGDWAEYCDPGDPASIRAAVERAYERPPPIGLAEHVRREYTWEKTAEATHRAYERVLA